MFKKIQIIAAGILVFFAIQSAEAAIVFSDISSSHPNYEAIMYLQENGIVEGYDDNTFRPDQLVNRAEALKIILLGSNVLVPEIQEQDIFPDVIHGTWYAKFVSKAKNLSIVSGDSDTGMFRPGDTINLAEIVKVLLETNNIEPIYEMSRRPYADVPTEAWFAPYFAYTDSINLIPEDENYNVFPATPVTRGMMANLMYQLVMKPEGYAEGESSYYGEKFHGKTTANGEIFDASGFTAAHRTLPFHTWLLVKNLENGETVKVRVNDRGPYAGENRIIDLSKAAFESISPLSRGVINVSIQPTTAPSAEQTSNLGADLLSIAECSPKGDLKYYSKSDYDNITLNNGIPSVLVEGEVLHISGITTSSASTISAFLVDEKENQYAYYSPTEDKNFELNVFFPESGTFNLGLLPGESGTSVIQKIEVLPKKCITENTDSALPPPYSTSVNLESGDTVIRWNKNDYQLFKLNFIQGSNSKTYFLYNTDEFKPYYPDFEEFSEGNINVNLQGAKLDKESILEPSSITWSNSSNISFNVLEHYEYIISDDQIEIIDLPDSATKDKTFTISVKPKVSMHAEAAIILPNGEVEKIMLESDYHEVITNSNGVEIFAPSSNELTLSYKPTSSDLHFVEINNADGLASLNIPLYPTNKYPLIPNPVELYDNELVDLGSDMNALRNQMLGYINDDRNDHGKSALVIDSSLNSLAQFRADDMIANSYFSHWDLQGRSANDLRKNYAISQVVAENIAKDITMKLAEYGLMRSALHRSNILNSEWTRAGIGITKDSDGGYVFVQIFSSDPINMSNTDSLRQNILTAVNNNRNSNLTLQSNLNNIAQDWSEKMVSEDFFDFTASDGTLVDTVRNAGINDSLGTYIVGNTSFQNAVDQISANTQITQSNWVDLGIGIEQDSLGIIKVTLIYTE